MTHHEPLAACPNCGTPFEAAVAPPNYCPHCGQHTTLHPPSVAEFVHEFAGHYVALEGSLWRTLRMLVTAPGRLTKEYLAGRRQRYVLPLRLYLSASFLFFLLGKVVGIAPGVVNSAQLEAPAAAHAASAPTHRAHRVPEPDCGAASQPPCTWLDRQIAGSLESVAEDPQRAQAEFNAHYLAEAPYAMFLMLPFFAGIVALLYRSRRMLFGEHLVFCMHLTTFWYLAAAVALVVPLAGVPLFLVGAAYAVRALHVVYGGRWPATLARATIAGIAVLALLLFGVVLLSILAAMQH